MSARAAALVLVLSLAPPVRAAPRDSHFSLAGGGDTSLSPDFEGHGFFLLRYDLGGLRRGAHFVIEYNTDTLRLSIDRLHVDRWELGFDVAGEVLLAGILSDYFKRGHNDGRRGLWASWVAAGVRGKTQSGAHFIELSAVVRRWFFTNGPDTAEGFDLPRDTWVGELRIHWTLWRVAPDPSLYQPHRVMPRVRGVAFGLDAGVDVRSDAAPWGARVLESPDLRNDPQSGIVIVRQWLLAGVDLGRRVRAQLAEVASWMWGEDDLVRLRIGGANPYVVPLYGAPWPAFLSGRMAAVDASLHIRVWRELELGPAVQGLVLDDVSRTGNPAQPGLQFGLGALVDWRMGAWQLDVRGGWSPTVRTEGAPSFSLFASLGWGH